jgi:hypothetical protein
MSSAIFREAKRKQIATVFALGQISPESPLSLAGLPSFGFFFKFRQYIAGPLIFNTFVDVSKFPIVTNSRKFVFPSELCPYLPDENRLFSFSNDNWLSLILQNISIVLTSSGVPSEAFFLREFYFARQRIFFGNQSELVYPELSPIIPAHFSDKKIIINEYRAALTAAILDPPHRNCLPPSEFENTPPFNQMQFFADKAAGCICFIDGNHGGDYISIPIDEYFADYRNCNIIPAKNVVYIFRDRSRQVSCFSKFTQKMEFIPLIPPYDYPIHQSATSYKDDLFVADEYDTFHFIHAEWRWESLPKSTQYRNGVEYLCFIRGYLCVIGDDDNSEYFDGKEWHNLSVSFHNDVRKISILGCYLA